MSELATGARLEDGWLSVPYDGPELVVIEIGIGGQWIPAFLDWQDGRRVAKIPRTAPVGEVRIRHHGPQGRQQAVPPPPASPQPGVTVSRQAASQHGVR